jgi:membrane-associated HD superfamily phosphohydrolase
MKKIIFLTIAGVISITSFSQEKNTRTPEERASTISARMEKNLGLSAEQKQKVYNLALDNIKKIESIREQDKNDKQKMRDEIKKERESYDAGIKSILTPAQYKKWTEEKEKAKEKEMQKHEQQKTENNPSDSTENK